MNTHRFRWRAELGTHLCDRCGRDGGRDGGRIASQVPLEPCRGPSAANDDERAQPKAYQA